MLVKKISQQINCC